MSLRIIAIRSDAEGLYACPPLDILNALTRASSDLSISDFVHDSLFELSCFDLGFSSYRVFAERRHREQNFLAHLAAKHFKFDTERLTGYERIYVTSRDQTPLESAAFTTFAVFYNFRLPEQLVFQSTVSIANRTLAVDKVVVHAEYVRERVLSYPARKTRAN